MRPWNKLDPFMDLAAVLSMILLLHWGHWILCMLLFGGIVWVTIPDD